MIEGGFGLFQHSISHPKDFDMTNVDTRDFENEEDEDLGVALEDISPLMAQWTGIGVLALQGKLGALLVEKIIVELVVLAAFVRNDGNKTWAGREIHMSRRALREHLEATFGMRKRGMSWNRTLQPIRETMIRMLPERERALVEAERQAITDRRSQATGKLPEGASHGKRRVS